MSICTETTERCPWVVEMKISEASFFLSILTYATSHKCSLVVKIIISHGYYTIVPVNRITRSREKINMYTEWGGSIIAGGRCGTDHYIGLLFMASV